MIRLSSKLAKIALIVFATCVLLSIYLFVPFSYNVDLSDNRYYIAHAAGAINGHTYTNSKEAILHAINQNYSYIELDLQLTKDSTLVCSHDPVDTLTTQQFLSQRISNRYTPLTLIDALEIRKKHPFTLIIDKMDDANTLDKFFINNKADIYVETYSWKCWKVLNEKGYNAMLNMSSRNVFQYIYYCMRCKQIITWTTSSANSYGDILRLRVLKRLFGVKTALYLIGRSALDFKDNIGRDIDLIYIDDKSIFLTN